MQAQTIRGKRRACFKFGWQKPADSGTREPPDSRVAKGGPAMVAAHYDEELRERSVARFAQRAGIPYSEANAQVPRERPDIVLAREARKLARETGMTYQQAADAVCADDPALALAWMDLDLVA